MRIGYARVSRGDSQDCAHQEAALRAAGCARVFVEEASGGSADRPVLAQALGVLGAGDVLVVWKLDRLGRSLVHLLFTLDEIARRGAGFCSLTEAIDTTTAAGRLMMQMLGAFAEFEREMIRERTRHGLENARRAGRRIGRRPKLTGAQKAEIVRMLGEGRGSIAYVAGLFRVSTSTVKRVVAAARRHQAGNARSGTVGKAGDMVGEAMDV